MNVKTCCRLCCSEKLLLGLFDNDGENLNEIIYLLTSVKVFYNSIIFFSLSQFEWT